VNVMHDHLAADPKFCDRFKRETLLMAKFHHPYAVTLFDASLNDPQGPCIVMEYIKGIPLEDLLQANKGRMNPARVGRMLGQICEVLQAAHHQGIIHRDLKPANLMVVDADTPYEKTKVMDFGLAKLVDPPDFNRRSVTGMDFAGGASGECSRLGRAISGGLGRRRAGGRRRGVGGRAGNFAGNALASSTSCPRKSQCRFLSPRSLDAGDGRRS